MTAPPVCDLDPTHGEMRAEHIYHLDGTINRDYPMYWFCQVKDCDGYGGPIERVKEIKKTAKRDEAQPMLFEI